MRTSLQFSEMDDARHCVHENLAMTHEPKVVWNVEHESGCWLMIRDAYPCMIIQWKLTASYARVPFTVAYHCPTLDGQANLASAIALCEKLVAEGPPKGVMSAKGEQIAKNKVNGASGGRAKAEKEKAKRAEYVEARRIADKFGFADIPVYDPKLWTYEADDSVKGSPRFTLCRNGTDQEVCVETMLISVDAFGRKVAPFWRIRRYWPANRDADSSILEDNVLDEETATYNARAKDKGLSNALPFLNRVLLSDPRFWNKDDVEKFL